MNIVKFLIRYYLVTIVCLFYTNPAIAAPTVQSGFKIEEFASVPYPQGMVFPRAGSNYTAYMYVGSNGEPGSVRGLPANIYVDDKIYALTAAGQATEFATLFGESDPASLAFPPAGSSFPDVLYVSANNRDGYQRDDRGGAILTIDPSGLVNDFTSVPPDKLFEPAGIAFGPGGDFGADLYVANSRDRVADILTVDSMGNESIFMNDGLFFPIGLDARGIAFGPGGDFGTDLYFANRLCQCVNRVSATGAVPTTTFSDVGRYVFGMAFGRGGAFGNDLFVSTKGTPAEIWRIKSDGSKQLFASGFEYLFHGPLLFASDGVSLYVADRDASKIYRIAVDNPDQDGDGVNDDIDNCPTTPNSDQSDLDGDGAGDACDPDDDNDNINDDIDNCPVTANADQANFDGDGEGDACDLDDDNDGVNDDVDNFPYSDTRATVVIGSCDSGVANQVLDNGATFNDLIASLANSITNHGRFVSAVGKLTNSWKKDKLISGRDYGKIKSCAAKSK